MKWKSAALTILLFASLAAAQSRDSIDDKYKWNLKDIFVTPAAMDQTLKDATAKLDGVNSCKGKMGESPAKLKDCLDLLFGVYQEYQKVLVYTSMQYDENLKNLDAQKEKGDSDLFGIAVREKTAWLTPELQSLGKGKIEAMISENSGLAPYRQYLADTLRLAEHTLSAPEEAILSRAGMLTNAPHSVFAAFSNSDLEPPVIKLSDGSEARLNAAGYARYRGRDNRDDRKAVFDAFWNNYKKYENTFGVLLNAQLQGDWFTAKSRKYASSVDAALGANNVPTGVYTRLLEDVNKNLGSLQRYLTLRKKMLALDNLTYYDMYPSIVKNIDLKYPYADSQAIILDAMKPLNAEYRKALEEAFSNRWIDVYPNEGKRSGAYSTGNFFTAHPYMLLNYNDDYESISTLAHELGHSMHSYFSSKNQPFPTSDYAIFVAEVASTFNEILLNEYLLSRETDPEKKLFLLGNMLERARQTIFRQAMFAEFELETHRRVENGETLTGADLSNLYLGLLKKYHGHDRGVCEIDDLYGIEWAYIPHFYYNFYVYQYATGLVASTALAERVMANEKGSVDAYLNFLKSGSSVYPVDALKTAGVDLTTSVPFEITMKSFNRTMDRIEATLKEMGK